MSYSSSTDETENEERMKELFKQRRIILRRQHESKRKKNNNSKSLQIISTLLADPRLISSSSTKENQKHPGNLKRRLSVFLKQQSYIADAKVKLERNKIQEAQNKEEQMMGESPEFKFNEDRTKVKVKKIKDPTQERLPPHFWQPSMKKYYKGLDKNGNILKHANALLIKTPVRTKTQPILDISHIVDEIANEFKSSIKNAIVKCTNFVPLPYSVGDKVSSDDDTSKGSSRSSKESQSSDTTSTDERSIAYMNRSKNSDKVMRKTHTGTQDAENLGTQGSNDFSNLLTLEEYKNNLLGLQKDQLKKSLPNEKNRVYKNIVKGNKESVRSDKKWEKHTEFTQERYQNLGRRKRIFENAYQSSEDEVFEQNEKHLTRANHEVPKRRRKIGPRIWKYTTRKKETFAADFQLKKKSKFEEIEIEIKPEKRIDKYLSSLPQYDKYKTVARVPKSWIKVEPLSSCHAYSKKSDPKFLDGTTDSQYAEGKSFADAQSQPTEEYNGPVSNYSQKIEKPLDSKTTKILQTEESNNFKLSGLDVNECLFSVRQKYEKEIEKEKRNEKGRNYETLKKERLKCQERIDKVVESSKILAQEQQHSKRTYKLSSYEESSDGEAFEQSKNTTKIVPKQLTTDKTVKRKTYSKVSRREKFQKTKPPLSPILIYHYYRPISKQPGKEATSIYSDVTDTNLETENLSSLPTPKTRKRIGPKTPPPEDSSTSEDEIAEKISEENKLKRSSVESFSALKNRERFLKKSRNDEGTLDSSLQKIRTMKTNTSKRKLSIHYEPMIITKALGFRSITKSYSG